MLQTDRKTEATPKRAQDREKTQPRQKRDIRTEAAAALEAILVGVNTEQLPARGVLALSHTIGNAALTEMLALRSAGPKTAAVALPEGRCDTVPIEREAGVPTLAETPDFGAMSPIAETAPLSL